jgi:hypothetical protein
VPRFRLVPLPLLGLALVLGLPAARPARAKPGTHKAEAATCWAQKILPFLVRKNFLHAGATDSRAHTRAVRWRAEKYGYVPGLGLEAYTEAAVADHLRQTRFMGLPITLHERVVPQLACVERRIRQRCRTSQDSYHPKAIGGVRTINTYHQGEISNHLFGIAIDIDPDRNPCCHCVDPWPAHASCQKPARSIYERTELPRCWIDAFEQQGFYWLGHDQLEDTMHFEYLADPDAPRKQRQNAPRPSARRQTAQR